MRGSNGAGAFPGTPAPLVSTRSTLPPSDRGVLRHGRHGRVAGADPDAGRRARTAAGSLSGARCSPACRSRCRSGRCRDVHPVHPPPHDPHVQRAAPVRHEARVDAAVACENPGSTATPEHPALALARRRPLGTARVRSVPPVVTQADRRRRRSVNTIAAARREGQVPRPVQPAMPRVVTREVRVADGSTPPSSRPQAPRAGVSTMRQQPPSAVHGGPPRARRARVGRQPV